MKGNYIAIDLGATSGRVILASGDEDGALQMALSIAFRHLSWKGTENIIGTYSRSGMKFWSVCLKRLEER